MDVPKHKDEEYWPTSVSLCQQIDLGSLINASPGLVLLLWLS